MKKFLKTICIVMALSVMMSLLTACPNDAKSSSQKDDRTDLTTRQTETELKPGLSEPDQTISTMDTEKEKETTEPETSSSEVTTASQTTAKPTAKPKARQNQSEERLAVLVYVLYRQDICLHYRQLLS